MADLCETCGIEIDKGQEICIECLHDEVFGIKPKRYLGPPIKTPEEKALEMCQTIIDWSGRARYKFDTKFVLSVEKDIMEGCDVSDGQFGALENIIRRFRIKKRK